MTFRGGWVGVGCREFGGSVGLKNPHFSQRTREMGHSAYIAYGQRESNPHPFDKLRAGSLAENARRVGHPLR
jgi:hypothetical protein